MKAELTELVKKTLAGSIPYLALRGEDSLAREGGDLDFMVPHGHAVMACKHVTKAALAEGWLLLGFRDIGYLAQIILIRPQTHGADDVLKIDFFDGLRWYGVGADVAGRQLFDLLSTGEQNEKKLAGVAGFLQKALIVGQLSERDWARVVVMGVDANDLTEFAHSLCLPIGRDQVAARGVTGLGKWRLRAALGGVSNPIAALAWLLRVIFVHLKFKSGLETKYGFLIGVSGLDGSGKSTLVDRLLASIRKAGGEPPQLLHLLPNWIPLPHQIFRRRKSQTNYTKPYSEPPVSSRLNGWLRLGFYLCAFTVGNLALWLDVKRGRLVIADRCFLDFASDLTRSRIPAGRLPVWLLRMLMPEGRFFYLDALPEVVVARKGELTLEKAHTLRVSYCETCNAVGGTLLSGDSTADEVFKETLAHVSKDYMQRLESAKSHQ